MCYDEALPINERFMMFDKTKPYGSVSGHETGAAYEQNGKLYFANGEPVSEPVSELVSEPVSEPVSAPKVSRRR